MRALAFPRRFVPLFRAVGKFAVDFTPSRKKYGGWSGINKGDGGEIAPCFLRLGKSPREYRRPIGSQLTHILGIEFFYYLENDPH